ncbi:MAG: ribonuclease M5 [Firmicutes bacterium]|nr:ribonuclease M5 [Bacillota bacterium]
MTEFKKLKIEQVIVVEGRDDTNAVLRAIDGMTIETHGFGIRRETWNILEKAYEEKGLIIFTDPDFSGEEIRRKLTARFPNSGQAFLTRREAEKKGDIGIENARPEDIAAAISKVHFISPKGKDRGGSQTCIDREADSPVFAETDLIAAGLLGGDQARARREALGAVLGIGYGNGKAFLKKLNQFHISRKEFEEALKGLEE